MYGERLASIWRYSEKYYEDHAQWDDYLEDIIRLRDWRTNSDYSFEGIVNGRDEYAQAIDFAKAEYSKACYAPRRQYKRRKEGPAVNLSAAYDAAFIKADHSQDFTFKPLTQNAFDGFFSLEEGVSGGS